MRITTKQSEYGHRHIPLQVREIIIIIIFAFKQTTMRRFCLYHFILK